MRHARRTSWLMVLLLVTLAAPTPRLAGALLTTRIAPGSPIGGKPPELRGRNRIGHLPLARCVTDQVPRRDSRRRERPTTPREYPLAAGPPPCAGRPAPTPHRVIHLRC